MESTFDELYRQIGRLKAERDFLSKKVTLYGKKSERDDRSRRAETEHFQTMPDVEYQPVLLILSAKTTHSGGLELMRLIDKKDLKPPWWRSRKVFS